MLNMPLWAFNTLMVSLFAGITALFVYSVMEQHRFITDNECKRIRSVASTTVPVFTANGSVSFAVIPGNNTYLCKDNKEYTF